MHRNDDSNYFLYIEPSIKEKSIEPIDDVYTEAIQWAFDAAESGSAYYSNLNDRGHAFSIGCGWRGIHQNCDDAYSSSNDYRLSNGYITNSLCVHYVRWFRNSIQGHNLEKLETIKNLYLEWQE